jgi:serine/threonine-protein kinase
MHPASLLQPSALLDRASTLTFGFLWLLCHRGHRSWRALVAVEWVGLAVAVAVMTLAGRYLAAEAIVHFAVQDPATDPSSLALAKAADAYVSIMILLAGALIFAIRAAIVPSPPGRTFLLNALLGVPFVAVPFFFAPASVGAPALRAAHFPVVGAVAYTIWWAIVTVGATVVSSVVFGLRAEVRRARRLGQYTIEAKIGEGGMGVVYRAHHGMMRRPTAIKLLRPDKAVETNLKRFEREVQLTARLTHPHTITIFDYGRTPDGVFYYAMELLDGASLEKVVAVGGPMEPARVVHVLYEVAGALVEAHDIGLIHRDIKPANIILCRQGGLYDFPKVVDFGLVKDLEPGGDAALTRADVIAGTPLYIAPEAITSPESVSPRSDLYSLGAVGYFALTGHNVFQGRTLVEVCSHHLHTKPEPPSKRLSQPLPADLEALVLDCLEKDPGRRPAGARELRRRLEACAAFGGWTDEHARVWWAQNGEAAAPDASEVPENELTLSRRLDSPA